MKLKQLKKRNGILIRVDRDYKLRLSGKALENKEYLLKHANLINNPNIGDHPSETELDNYDGFKYHIQNNGSIQDLIERVREILVAENIIK